MAIAAALFAGYSAYNSQNSNELTDIALANIEALAGNENNPCDNINGYKKWYTENNTLGTDRLEGFHDCCYQHREGYSPNTKCESN